MIFKKTFKFRLCPNQEQANLCLQFAGASRWIYNRALDQRDKTLERGKTSISLYSQNEEYWQTAARGRQIFSKHKTIL